MHLEQAAETRRLLAAAVAQLKTDLLIFLRGHGFEQSELLGHETQSNVHAAKQGIYPVGVFLLKVVVNVEKRIANQLHPHFFYLVDELELHLVCVAEILEILLAGKKRLGVQIDFVVECSFPVHDGIKMRAVHRISQMLSARRSLAGRSYSIAIESGKRWYLYPIEPARGAGEGPFAPRSL